MFFTSNEVLKNRARAIAALTLLTVGFFLSLTSGISSTNELFIVVVSGLFLLLLLPRRRPKLLSIEAGLYFFILGLIPSVVFSPASHLSLLTFAKLIAACGYLLGAHYVATEVKEQWPKKCFTFVLLGGLTLLCLFGLEQMIFPQKMPAHWVSQQQHQILPFRVTSLFINPNLWGGFTAVATALLFALALQSEDKRKRRAFLLLLVLVVINLTATFSRGAWLCALVALGLTTAFCKWRKLKAPGWKETIGTLVLVTLLLGLWLYPPVKARLDSMKNSGELGMNQRSLLYRGVFRHIKANLPFGSGLRTFQTLFPRYRLAGGQYVYEAHSDPLHILAESGLPGFLGLLAMGFIFICLCGQSENSSLVGMATLFGFLLATNVVTFLHYTFMTIPLFMAVGFSLPKPKERADELPFLGQMVIVLLVFASLLYWQRLWSSQPYYDQAKQLYHLAKSQKGKNKTLLLTEATKQIDLAMSWLPIRDDGRYLSAQISQAMDDLIGANFSLRLASKRNPLEATYLAALSDVAKRRGKKKEALDYLNRALAGDPYSERILLQKALFLEEMGKIDEAIEILEKALQTNPQFLKINPKAYLPVFSNLLRLLQAMGYQDRLEKVRKTYGKLLSLPPSTR